MVGRSRNKFGNIKTTAPDQNGKARKYDSRAEARRAAELAVLVRAGEVEWWQPQASERPHSRIFWSRVL